MPRIDEDRTSVFLIEESGKTWTLTRDTHIRIAGTGNAIREESGSGTKLMLQGTIIMDTSINAAVALGGTDTFLHITKTGTIIGEMGAAVNGDKAVVLNEGMIHAGTGYGLASIGTDAKITNAGTIMGSAGVRLWGNADGSEFINGRDGTISVSQIGVSVVVLSGSNRIVNHGYIYAGENAVLGDGGQEKIINRGGMDGNVRLNGGDDVFDTRHGSFNGIAFGGEGDDTYFTNNGSLVISENANEGIDTVKSGFSFALQDNIERLILTGSKNLNGVGSATGSTIEGNAGKNILVGLDASDQISGGKGNDRMTGGGAQDDFIFYKNMDVDTIVDLSDGDIIAILGFKNAHTYSEVKKLMSDHGDDVWITLGGGDRIVIKDVEKSDLIEDYFNFSS